ncbi:hypothetical protein KEJ26_07160 [Candidatus Bathyarchaeota archaeon]|nr:hypothetical protein [Candidatus Bathyarchaeota archaeon]
MISNLVPIRLERDCIKWLDECAITQGQFFRGKPNRSAVIKQLIKQAQAKQTESAHPPPTADDKTQLWKDFPEYVELREQGLSHSQAARKLGLLRLPPEVERAYEKRYMDSIESEANFVLLILEQYLDESTMERLTMLTDDPIGFIVKCVREYIKVLEIASKIILDHPQCYPETDVEQARLFLQT